MNGFGALPDFNPLAAVEALRKAHLYDPAQARLKAQLAHMIGVPPYSSSLKKPVGTAPVPHNKGKKTQGASSGQADGITGEEDDDDSFGDGLEEEQYHAVSTEGLEKLGLRRHPDAIAECASLSSVQAPLGAYRCRLPAHVILNGISALQFEAVRLACQRHETMLPDGTTRAGFFLGDGPGVGKGRQVAALILENFLQGRTKAIWFSVCADLAIDAERDLKDIGALGYEEVHLHDLKRIKAKPWDRLLGLPGMKTGVLFSTYDLLISGRQKKKSKKDPSPSPGLSSNGADGEEEEDQFGEGTRLQQIIDWFGEDYDGLIVLDECHRAKNCVPVQEGRKKQAESKTSRAVIELQRRCKNARVLFVSATGATEPENLCYMTRLGLWGPSSPYRDQSELVKTLKSGGVGAMELVAMELKQSGSYLARALSYQGVTFEQKVVEVGPEYINLYNSAVDLWQAMWVLINQQKQAGQLLSKDKVVIGQYWGGHLRFFRQLCTAAKVSFVEAIAKEQLAKGNCVVIGLQSTGEARTEAFVQENGGEDATFDQFVEPAALIPGKILKSYVTNCPKRQELLAKFEALKLPKNPLDDLIERLGGPSQVAEMTGRKKRMLRQRDGSYKYVSRALVEDHGTNVHLDEVNLAEKTHFQAGEKLVAIISDAASTGISLQADKSQLNQRKRVHITLELAWAADKTVQQLGRTHRSNQAQPPHYMLACTDIAGESRFASAVAKRLEQLGALTHGDRHSASASNVLAAFNIQTKHGRLALKRMYQIFNGLKAPPEDLTPQWAMEDLKDKDLEPNQTGFDRARTILMQDFVAEAKDELSGSGVNVLMDEEELVEMAIEDDTKKKKHQGCDISKLLNRMLGIHVQLQSKIFGYFMTLLDAQIKEAKKKGEYNEQGIIKPSCSDIRFVKKDVVYKNPHTGAESYLYKFQTDKGIKWETVLEKYKKEKEEDPDSQSCFAYHDYTLGQVNKRNYVLAMERNDRGRKSVMSRRLRKMVPAFYRLIRPATGFASSDISYQDFKKNFKIVPDADIFGPSNRIKNKWNEEYSSKTKQRHQDLFVVGGTLLPLMAIINHTLESGSRLGKKKNRLQIFRVETTDAKPVSTIGIAVPSHLEKEMAFALKDLSRREEIAVMTGPGPSIVKPDASRGSSTPMPDNTPSLPEVVSLVDDESSDDDQGDHGRKAPRTKGIKRSTGKRQGQPIQQRVDVDLSVGNEQFPETITKLMDAGLWESAPLTLTVRTAPVVNKWSAKIGPDAKVQRSPEEVDEEEDDDQPLLLRMKQSMGNNSHGKRAAATPPYRRSVVSPRGMTPESDMELICDDDDDDDVEITEEEDEDLSLSDSESVEGDDQEDNDNEEDQREERKGRGRPERVPSTREDRVASTVWGSTARRNTPRRSRSPSPLGLPFLDADQPSSTSSQPNLVIEASCSPHHTLKPENIQNHQDHEVPTTIVQTEGEAKRQRRESNENPKESNESLVMRQIDDGSLKHKDDSHREGKVASVKRAFHTESLDDPTSVEPTNHSSKRQAVSPGTDAILEVALAHGATASPVPTGVTEADKERWKCEIEEQLKVGFLEKMRKARELGKQSAAKEINDLRLQLDKALKSTPESSIARELDREKAMRCEALAELQALKDQQALNQERLSKELEKLRIQKHAAEQEAAKLRSQIEDLLEKKTLSPPCNLAPSLIVSSVDRMRTSLLSSAHINGHENHDSPVSGLVDRKTSDLEGRTGALGGHCSPMRRLDLATPLTATPKAGRSSDGGRMIQEDLTLLPSPTQSSGLDSSISTAITCQAIQAVLASSGGMTAAACAQHFGCSGPCSSKIASYPAIHQQRSMQLAACLKELVQDLEVFRKGGCSNAGEDVNLADEETIYMIL